MLLFCRRRLNHSNQRSANTPLTYHARELFNHTRPGELVLQRFRHCSGAKRCLLRERHPSRMLSTRERGSKGLATRRHAHSRKTSLPHSSMGRRKRRVGEDKASTKLLHDTLRNAEVDQVDGWVRTRHKVGNTVSVLVHGCVVLLAGCVEVLDAATCRTLELYYSTCRALLFLHLKAHTNAVRFLSDICIINTCDAFPNKSS